MSDVDRDQLPESLPLMLQQLCLLRARIPAGQAHFALITCADLRGGRATGGEGRVPGQLELRLFPPFADTKEHRYAD